MKNWFWVFTINFTFLLIVGCGTDVKPSTFIGIVRDGSDIDDLSACLSDTPEVDDKQIKITLDKQCLIDFSQQDQTDPNLAPSFAEIVRNPEIYMDRLLTFEAVLKKVHSLHHIELYTNDNDLRFYIHTHGASLYRLDEEGEEVPLQPNETYRFKCRIFEFKKHVDHGRVWEANAEFIVSTNKKIIHLPELVE